MAEPASAEIVRRARRVLWACGLCFALLFLLGLSGLASVTLLYDDPMLRTNARGLEGAVVRFLASVEPAVRILHGWGGYVAIVLCGWAGIEIFGFSRLIRRSDKTEWRSAGRRMAPFGVIGAAVIVIALLLLIPTGEGAGHYLKNEAPAVIDDVPNPERVHPRLPGEVNMEDPGDSSTVDLHTRELNYLLAIGAFLVLFAVASTRRVQLEAKKAEPAQASSQK